MNKFYLLLSLIACLCLVLPLNAEGLRGGVVAIDLAPPVGTPLAGYSARMQFPPDLDPDNYHTFLKPSEGTMDPVTAKVVVLENNGSKIALVKLDSIGVSQGVIDDVVAIVEPATGIDRNHLSIMGTHTHSGPGAMKVPTMWAVAAVDVAHPGVHDVIVRKIADAIITANEQLAPVRLGISTGLVFDLTRNRRGHPGVFDPVMAVFKIDKADGTPLALLFNFAVHGTGYGSSNMLFSADVMGHSERQIEKVMMEKKTPVMAMFINGSEGDVSPAKGSGKGTTEVGIEIGNEVLNIAPQISTRSDVTLAVANEYIQFDKAHLHIDILNPGRFEHQGEIDCWGLMRNLKPWIPELPKDSPWKIKIEVTPLVETKFRLQAVRIGDAVIACVPAEPLTKFGDMVKTAGREAGFTNTFVFGLANGHMGYICDEENFDEGGYEAMLTLYGRDTAAKLTEVYGRLFRQLQDGK